MKNILSKSRQAIAFALATLLILTSVPEASITALAATTENPEDVDAIIYEEDEENEVSEDSIEELNSYNDVQIAAIPGNTAASSKSVAVATAANGSVTKIADDGLTNVNVNSESAEAYTFYIVPLSGYEIVDAPLTVTGSYTTADGDDATTATVSELTITPISDTEKTMDISGATNFVVSASQDTNKYNWDDAVKVVVKGGTGSFLAGYKAAATKTNGLTIGLADTMVQKKTFEIPVYVYDASAAEGNKYTQVLVNSSTGKSKLSATYNTLADGNIDFSDAFSATEWANYTTDFKVLTAGTTETFGTASTNLTVTEATSWDATEKASEADKYQITSDHKLGLTAQLAGKIYLNAAAHPTETALVLLTKSTKYSITAASTSYVNFETDDSGTKYDGKTTRDASNPTKLKDTAAANTFSATATKDTKSGRTLTGLYYTIGDGESTKANYASDTWTIPAGAGNVVITGETTETVEFKETGWSSSNKIAVTLVDGNETAITPAYSTDQASHTTTVLSGTGDLSFKVAPAVAGYNVGEVTVTRYKIDGSAALDGQSGIVLSPVNGVYTIEDVAGYVEVNIAVEAVTGTKRAVSIASGSDTGADIKDLKTGKALTTSGVEYAVDTADYQFTVEPKAGYALAATDPVTVTANGETVTATKSGTTYTIAKTNLTGPIIITVNTTAMLDVQKAENSYVGIALDGTSLGTDPVQVSTSGKISLTLTPATGVTVSDVYYAETAPDSTTAAPATKFTKKTGSDDVYELDASAVYKFRVTDNHPTMYIYVKYSRDAVEGTDFVARTTNGKQTDGTNYDVIGASGITLYAGGATVTGSGKPNNLIDKITTHFYAVSDTKYETALDGTNTTYALALEGETGKVATETEISGVDTITTAAKYVSTGMTDTLTATFTKTYTSDVKWNQTIVYKKEIPVTIKSLSDYYKTTYGTLAAYVDSNTGTTNDGSVLDELRNDTSDTATLKLAYTDETENDVVVTSSLATVTKNTWSVSPETATAALNAEYKVNNATVNPVDNNDVTVGNAKFATIPANGLTVTGAVTFIDDSTTIASKTLKVVENDYGYFAVPTVTINGESNIALSATNTISLEYGSDAKNAAKTATVSYAVYHAKTSTGKSFAYTTQANLDGAVTAGDIELVAASNIDWANATLVGTDTDYAKKYTVTNNNDGTFTITAKAVITGDELKLTAKEKTSGFALKTKGSTATQVTVVYAKPRVAVTFTTNDSSTAYPELTAAYLATVKESYTVETVKSGANVTGYVLTDVPTGTILPLPAVSAFSGVAESKGIASWKITAGTDTYAKADGTGTATISQATNITPVWASLYSAQASTYVAGIEPVNSVTEDAFDNSSNVVIVGSTPVVSVSAQYYALDPAPAAPSGTAAYATTATPITTGTLAISAASEDATAFGATLNATTGKYDFAGTTLNPTEGTNAFDATVTWTPVGATTGLTGTIKNLQAKANGTEWVLDHDTVEVEVGQEITDTSLTLTKDGSAAYLNSGSIVSKTLEISTANQTYATAEITTDSSNTLTFTGKAVTPAAGIPATLTIVDKENQTKTLDITIVVKAASYAIEANVTHSYGSDSITEATKTTIGANDTAELVIGSNTLDLSLTNADVKPISVAWTIKSTAPSGVDAPANMFGTEVNETSSDTAASKTISPTKLGASTLTLTATVTDATTNTVIGKYTREIPLTSAAVVKVYGPDATNTNFGGNGKTEYASYSVSKGGTAFANAEYDVILVPYVKDATEYTVSDITNYTVTWLDSATTSQDFLGWKVGGDSSKGAISKTTTDLTVASSTGDALANTAAVIDTSVAEAGPAYYAFFKAAGIIGVSVENKIITLSDATLDADYTKATNKDVIEIRVTPAQTTEKISVSSADTGFIDIADGVATSGTVANAKSADVSKLGADVTATAGTSITTDANNYAGGAVLPLDNGSAGTTYRTDKLLVGKVDGKVGATALTIWDEAGTTALETITVYVNGEYTDDTVTPNVTRYMKNGEILKNDSAIVNGETHYYDADGVKVTSGPFYVESAGKFILLDTGAQVKTVGKHEITTGDYAGTYYVGDATDGYLLTGLFAGVGTNDTDKKYYADPETGALTISNKAEVSEGKYSYFNAYGQMEVASSSANLYEKVSGADYYVNAAGELAIGDIFTVNGVERLFDESGAIITYADTKGTGKYTVNNIAYVINEDDNSAKPDHTDHSWSFVDFTWSPTTGVPTSAVANFICDTGKESDTVNAEITAGKARTSEDDTVTITPYTAKVTVDPAKKAISQSETVYYSTATGTYTTDSSAYKALAKSSYSTTEDGDVAFTLEYDEHVYTGYALKPVVYGTNGEKTLVQGVDFTVAYKNNINKGDASVTVKGKGDYTGTYDLSFKITEIDINKAVVGAIVVKTGTALAKIKPVVTYKGKALRLNTDFAATPGSDGESLEITGQGNFTGSRTEAVKFAVPTKLKVTVSKMSYTYDGSTKDPIADGLITVDGKTKDDIYDIANVTYSDNVNAGTCKITITAIAAEDSTAAGTVTKSFKIAPNKATLTAKSTEDEYVVKSTGVKPAFDVTAKVGDDDVALKEGVDYKVSYSKNKVIGQGSAKITGLGNYKGASTTASFEIVGGELSEEDIALPGEVALIANKKNKQFLVNPVVELNGSLLKVKKDYTVKWLDADEKEIDPKGTTLKADDVVTVEVTLTAAAASEDATPVTKDYTIVSGTALPKVKLGIVDNSTGKKVSAVGYTGLKFAFEDDASNPDYQGKPLYTPSITITKGATITGIDNILENFDVQYVNNVTKGSKVTMILTAKEGSGYVGSQTVTFKIGASRIKDLISSLLD